MLGKLFIELSNYRLELLLPLCGSRFQSEFHSIPLVTLVLQLFVGCSQFLSTYCNRLLKTTLCIPALGKLSRKLFSGDFCGSLSRQPCLFHPLFSLFKLVTLGLQLLVDCCQLTGTLSDCLLKSAFHLSSLGKF